MIALVVERKKDFRRKPIVEEDAQVIVSSVGINVILLPLVALTLEYFGLERRVY
jgi:hypothetical protein